VTNYVSDGTDIVAEYDGAGALLARFAFGGMGEPLAAYDAAGTRSWMTTDERGSVIALASDSAAMTAINTYDEYGVPSASNAGAVQYAGQMWLSRPGLSYNMFRAYAPQLGRFNQTDLIGYGGGMNLYAYVGNDPVNATDPMGLVQNQTIVVKYCGSDETWDGSNCVSSNWAFLYDLGLMYSGLSGPTFAFNPLLSIGRSGGGSIHSDASGENDQKDEDADTKEGVSESKTRCRSAVTGSFMALLGGYSIYDVGEAIHRSSEITQKLTALDFLKAGSRGAFYGGRFGPWAGGGGFVVFAGGLFAWDRYHEQILEWACGGK
jgi:RHS repeat-associated protein